MRIDRVGLVFEPRDFWAGVYVTAEKYPLEGGRCRRVYVLPLPMLGFWFRVTWGTS